MPSPGDVVGRWKLTRPLGAGGFGAVWAAHPTSHPGEEVAVKIIETSDRATLDRFATEAQMLRRLDHPAIVGYRGSGSLPEKNLFYLVMDKVSGQNLEALLDRGPMGVDDARRVFRDIADALRFAHIRGVYHRDLKPQNIMVRDDGSGCLIDLGIARQRGLPRITTDGMVPGTLAYLPPEVFREGTRTDDQLADVYALGLLMYEALTARRAFAANASNAGGHDGQSIIRLAQEKARSSPFDPGPGIPTDLRDLIKRSTHPDPELRLASMDKLAEKLGVSVPTAPGLGKAGTVWMGPDGEQVAARTVQRQPGGARMPDDRDAPEPAWPGGEAFGGSRTPRGTSLADAAGTVWLEPGEQPPAFSARGAEAGTSFVAPGELRDDLDAAPTVWMNPQGRPGAVPPPAPPPPNLRPGAPAAPTPAPPPPPPRGFGSGRTDAARAAAPIVSAPRAPGAPGVGGQPGGPSLPQGGAPISGAPTPPGMTGAAAQPGLGGAPTPPGMTGAAAQPGLGSAPSAPIASAGRLSNPAPSEPGSVGAAPIASAGRLAAQPGNLAGPGGAAPAEPVAPPAKERSWVPLLVAAGCLTAVVAVAAVGAVAWVLTQPADGTAASEGEAPTAPATPPASRQVELLGDPASPVWIDGKPVARGSGGPRLSSQPVGPHTVVVAAGSGCEAASPELVGPCCRTETVSLDLPAGDGPFPWQPPAVTAPDAKRALSLWATDATGADAPKLKWWINDKPVPAGTTELKDLPVGMIRWRLESGTCPAAALGCAGDGTCPPGCTSMRGEVELACGDGPQILSLTLPAAGEAASTTPAAPPAATDADGVRPTEPKPERKPRTEATQKQPTEPITTEPVEVRLDYQATVVGVSVDKGLDAATSGGGVAAKLGTLESCFAKSHTTGEFRGTVVVDFKVDKSGIVEASSVTASTRSGNNGVDACAVSAVKNAKISTKKPGAGRVKITFVAQ